jgi:hypothetical protein
MNAENPRLDEEFVRLSLAVDEHLPGYVDSYFGPTEWRQEAKQTGKLPLPDLAARVNQLAADVAQMYEWDAQRLDFLVRQISAMQMSLRLLGGENISLAEEVRGLYDVEPTWKDESNFLEAQKQWGDILPPGGSLSERRERWKKSLEVPIEKVKELLPYMIKTLQEAAHKKFNLPETESFVVEFVSNQPWSAYNWYLGNFKSRIDLNTDLPIRVSALAGLIAHEAYPGHHTELSIKEAGLIREKGYQEHVLTLINSPSCVIAEGIATSALETIFTDQELEDWYSQEILPRAGVAQVDPKNIINMGKAGEKMSGLWGNAAFMFHDHKKSPDEIISYLRNYEMTTPQEAQKAIDFISNPLYRSYVFTYYIGYDLLKELFSRGNRDQYFARLLAEPVTPSQIRGWIKEERTSDIP